MKKKNYQIYYLSNSRNPIDVKVNSCYVRMEVEIGASATVSNMET